MAYFNSVTLIGNLTRDPELKTLSSGKSVCNFGLAVNNDYKGTDGQWVKAPCFIDVQCWGKTGENVARLFHKGDNALVDGKLVMDQWEKDGKKNTRHKITASRVTFTQNKAKNGGADSSTEPAPDEK